MHISIYVKDVLMLLLMKKIWSKLKLGKEQLNVNFKDFLERIYLFSSSECWLIWPSTSS